MDITVVEFVELLVRDVAKIDSASLADFLRYGHKKGWLEDDDERHCKSLLVRRAAARIIHEFMRIELSVNDLPDISGAEVLKDLYTCRTCVNHVAQIYLREIIPSEEIEFNGQQAQIFNMLKPVTRSETSEIILKLKKIQGNI